LTRPTICEATTPWWKARFRAAITADYSVLWKGEIATSRSTPKSLRFAARLVEANNPVAGILDTSDTVRTFGGNALPIIPKSPGPR
jgi:hypothetical protein